MPETIRVNAVSVRSYGTSAQEVFGQIRSHLERLVNDVVNVHYYGPNAVTFKTESGTLASNFATAITRDMSAISGAVRASTSNIQQALGGPPVAIEFNAAAISLPAVPQGDGTVGANIEALDALKSTVRQHCSAVNEEFATHLSKLQATDWTGNAKNQAVEAVAGFTNSAKGKVEEAGTTLTGFIDKQIEALRRGDQ